jgi:hypothetical protein
MIHMEHHVDEGLNIPIATMFKRGVMADNLDSVEGIWTDGMTEAVHVELVSSYERILGGDPIHHDRRIMITFLSRRVQLYILLASGTFTQIVSFCTFVESYLYLLRGTIS